MIVVDCSLVVDSMVAADAEDLDAILSNNALVAPQLIDFEMTAVVRGLVLGRRIHAHRGDEMLVDYHRLKITRWDSAHDLRLRTLDLRDNFTAYDAAYVVLAEALDCPLVTRDKRLAKAATRLIDVMVV